MQLQNCRAYFGNKRGILSGVLLAALAFSASVSASEMGTFPARKRVPQAVSPHSSNPPKMRAWLFEQELSPFPRANRMMWSAGKSANLPRATSTLILEYLGSPLGALTAGPPAVQVDLWSSLTGGYLNPGEYSFSYDHAVSTLTLDCPSGSYMVYVWVDSNGDGRVNGPYDWEWWNSLSVPVSNYSLWMGRIIPILSPVSSYATYEAGTCTQAGATVPAGSVLLAWEHFPEPTMVDYFVPWVYETDCATGSNNYVESSVDPGVTSRVMDVRPLSQVRIGTDVIGGSSVYGSPIYLGLTYTYYFEDGKPTVDQGGRVRTSGALQVDPQQLSFLLHEGQVGTQTLHLGSTSGTASWQAASDAPWLTLSPSSGTVSVNSDWTSVSVTADPAQVPIRGIGTFAGTLSFIDPATSTSLAVIPVALTVVEAPLEPPSFTLTPTSMEFTAQPDAGSPEQKATLVNTGPVPFPWSAEPRRPWLTCTPSSGTLEPGASIDLMVSSSPSSEPGSDRGILLVHVPGADDGALATTRNIVSSVATEEWPPADEPTATIPVLVTGTGGAQGSFWSSDLFAAPVTGTARSLVYRQIHEVIERLLSDASLKPPERIDLQSISRSLTVAQIGPERGKTTFIWGAASRKTARQASAWVTRFTLWEDYSTLLSDMLGTYFGQGAAAALLQARGEQASDLLLWSRTFTTDARGWTYGQEVPDPGPDEVIGRTGGRAIVIGLTSTADFRSNLILAEIYGAATPVSVQLHDSNGVPVGSPITETLEPFSQWQINRVLEGTGASSGYAVVTSGGGGKVAVLGSIVDNHTNDPSTVMGKIPNALSAPKELYFPAAARAEGAFGTQWHSDITLYNDSVANLSVLVEYIPSAGASSGVKSATVPLAAGQMVTATDVLASLFGLEQGLGSIRLTSKGISAILAYSRIYTTTAGPGTYGQGFAACRNTEAIGVGDGPLYLIGLERSHKFRSNAGVLNIGTNDAGVLFTLHHPDLAPRGFMLSLRPGQLVQVNDIIRVALGVAQDLANVMITVTAVSDTGRVLAYGSVIDNQSQDATFVKGLTR